VPRLITPVRVFTFQEVLIEGSTILCGSGFVNKHQKPSYDSRSETLDLQLQECHSAQILFEETFFNQNDESYQVVCISQPLEQDLVQSRIGSRNFFTGHRSRVTVYLTLLYKLVSNSRHSCEPGPSLQARSVQKVKRFL